LLHVNPVLRDDTYEWIQPRQPEVYVLTSFPSMLTGRLDINLSDTTGQFLQSGFTTETTDADKRDKGDQDSNEDRKAPNGSAGVKVFDALLEIYLKMCHQADEKTQDSCDVLYDKELV